MPFIFNEKNVDLREKTSPIPEFAWHSSENLAELAESKLLHFNLRSLDPGKYSYPYHFHRQAEEVFVILSGAATLRTADGFRQLAAGDTVFFESGPSGAHQLYNHTDAACRYLDIRTEVGIDVCEYPDSGKVNILPTIEVFQADSKVSYYQGEDKVAAQWPAEIVARDEA